MPNDTLRATAQTMPIDRRAALGALAAGAVPAVPRIAKGAEHPDAELIAFAREAKQIAARLTAARAAWDDAEDRSSRRRRPPP